MKTLLTLTALCLAATAFAQAQNKGGGGSGSTGSTTPVGVIAIDQAKAEAGGITAGDTPGFPVTLSQPGSYRLNGNLVVNDPNTAAILITSPAVTLDLNGFAILGPVVASGAGAGLSCSNRSPNWYSGAGVLVRLTSPTAAAVLVANGTIAGMGGVGVVSHNDAYTARQDVSLRDLRLAGNGRGGVIGAAEARSVISDFNCGDGLYHVAAVRDSTTRFNAGWGIQSARVAHSLAFGNGGGEMVAASPLP